MSSSSVSASKSSAPKSISSNGDKKSKPLTNLERILRKKYKSKSSWTAEMKVPEKFDPSYWEWRLKKQEKDNMTFLNSLSDEEIEEWLKMEKQSYEMEIKQNAFKQKMNAKKVLAEQKEMKDAQDLYKQDKDKYEARKYVWADEILVEYYELGVSPVNKDANGDEINPLFEDLSPLLKTKWDQMFKDQEVEEGEEKQSRDSLIYGDMLEMFLQFFLEKPPDWDASYNPCKAKSKPKTKKSGDTKEIVSNGKCGSCNCNRVFKGQVKGTCSKDAVEINGYCEKHTKEILKRGALWRGAKGVSGDSVLCDDECYGDEVEMLRKNNPEFRGGFKDLRPDNIKEKYPYNQSPWFWKK